VNGKARDQAARLVGVNPRYVSDGKRVKELDPALFEEVKAGRVRVDRARRQVEREHVRRERARSVRRLPEGLRVGDFREVLADLPGGSVDAIVTDPPYNKAQYHLYADLASLAARVLAPGGSLVAYAPTYAVADLLPLMTPHLRFCSVLTVRHAVRLQRLNQFKLIVRAKLLLWFVKGRYDGQWLFNCFDGDPGDKDWHDHAQGVAEASYVIERMTPPGGMVLDCMCGGGTTLVAAKQLGRRYLGVELDRARARVAAVGALVGGVRVGPGGGRGGGGPGVPGVWGGVGRPAAGAQGKPWERRTRRPRG
jgi:hypothetical protein